MPRRLSAAAVGLVLVSLLALPACGKKKSTKPDTQTPDPTPAPVPTPNPNQNTQSDPTLPSPPTQRPMFATGVLGANMRQMSENNLKQIAIAAHNFYDVMNGFPAGIADKNGKLGLSWRVAILPYLEHDGLYKQFKLDEPWDSEHNRKLISQMPPVYAPPRTNTNGYTFYRSFSGNGAVLSPPPGPLRPGMPVLGTRLSGVTDGTSNTLMVAEAYDPVIWTKPEDLPFSPGKPPRLGGGVFGNGFCAAFCDGSVRFLPSSTEPQTLSALITTNGGEVVSLP